MITLNTLNSTLFVLSARIVIFHSAAALLTEATFRLPGFVFGWWFVSVHFVLFAVCSVLRTLFLTGPAGLLALCDIPSDHTTVTLKGLCHVTLTALPAYLLCGLAVALSHGCGSVAMVYLNFTTTALFKSAKVPATLLGGSCAGQKISSLEVTLAVGMALGLFVFGVAERYESPKFALTGLLFISVNLVVSSFSSNLQQLILQNGPKEEIEGSSINKLMAMQYAVASVLTLSWCLVSGELGAALQWYRKNGWFYLSYTVGDGVFTFAGLTSVYQISKLFDATRASVVCSSRKALTFVLSFLIYTKPFNSLHAVGLGLTLGCGFMLQQLAKAHQGSASPKLVGISPVGSQEPPDLLC